MSLGPRHSGRAERPAFGAIVALVPEGLRLRPLDAEDLVLTNDQATAVFELDNHFLGKDFQSQDPALSTTSGHPRADGRQFVLEGLVSSELVAQAALEPTTPPRNFRGI